MLQIPVEIMSDLPGSKQLVQTESVQYRAGVSESSLQAMGSAVNYCLFNTPPIGSVMSSFLTELQFQAETDTTWILADGRSIIGSDFAGLTGLSVAPDLRGMFLRGKNNTRSDGNQNPDGDLAVGTYQADQVGPHSHNIPGGSTASGGNPYTIGGSGHDANTATYGSTETRSKSVTVNHFLKINA